MDLFLRCKREHAICLKCVRKLLEPGRCKPPCSPFRFRCPCCREMNCVNRMQLLAVLKGSLQKAADSFPTKRQAVRWNEIGVSEDESEEEDEESCPSCSTLIEQWEMNTLGSRCTHSPGELGTPSGDAALVVGRDAR